MKMKKTIQTLALAGLLCFCAAPAMAAENIGNTELRVQVDPTYSVIIPASMAENQSLKAGINAVGTLKTGHLNLEPGTRLSCTLSGDKLTRQNDTESIAYKACYGSDKTAQSTILTENSETAVSVELDSAALAAAKAGVYKGTLNFSLSIVR